MDREKFADAGRLVMNRIIEALSKLKTTDRKDVPDTAAVFGLLAAAAMLTKRGMNGSRQDFLKMAGEMWDTNEKANAPS